MNVKTKFITMAFVATLLVLGSAGFAAAVAPVFSLETEISNGEITAEGGSYTGYVYLNNTDSNNHNLSQRGFIIFFNSSTDDVTLSNLKVGSALSGWVVNPTSTIDGKILIMNGCGGGNITVSSGDKIELAVFTINVDASAVNDDFEIHFISEIQGRDGKTGCGVYVDDLALKQCAYNGDLSLVNKTVSSVIPNTIVVNNNGIVNRVTEDYGDFIDNLTIYSETTKILTTMPEGWYVNYTSLNENAVRIFTNATNNTVQKYVVVGTANEAITVTANLTNSTTGSVLDSKNISVITARGTLINDYFDFPNPKVYNYTGVSVAGSVEKNLTLLNFTDPANNNDSMVPRVTNPIAITYYLDAYGDENITVPIESATYVFNISCEENPNYKKLDPLSITNHTFTISGGLIVPTVTQYGYFNATTKAQIIVNWTVPVGADKSASFLGNATLIPYQHGGNSYYNPSTDLSDSVWGYVNISKDNLTYDVPNHVLDVKDGQDNPQGDSVVVSLTGRKLGDLDGDDEITSADAGIIGTYLVSTGTVPDDVLFYGALHGAKKLSGTDQLRILQYESDTFGTLIDADYNLITSP